MDINAIKELFKELFGEQETLLPMFLYAVVVTVVAVVLIVWISKLAEKAEK